jgi:hypothetical protein
LGYAQVSERHFILAVQHPQVNHVRVRGEGNAKIGHIICVFKPDSVDAIKEVRGSHGRQIGPALSLVIPVLRAQVARASRDLEHVGHWIIQPEALVVGMVNDHLELSCALALSESRLGRYEVDQNRDNTNQEELITPLTHIHSHLRKLDNRSFLATLFPQIFMSIFYAYYKPDFDKYRTYAVEPRVIVG